MRVFIVHAHHEPKSFNAALTTAATEALQGANHQVRVSDLYAMRFDPVSDRRNFLTVRNRVYLLQQDEERYAAERDGFAPDIEGEMPFVAGRGAWPSALSRPRGFRVHRNAVESLDRRSGRLGAGFSQEGQSGVQTV